MLIVFVKLALWMKWFKLILPTRDFISDELKYFLFVGWSISCNRLYEIPWNEIHCSLFDSNEISFQVTECYVNTTPKWCIQKKHLRMRIHRKPTIRIIVVAFEMKSSKKSFVRKEAEYIFISASSWS